MKQVILRFYLPLTLITFGLVTKWWFGLVIGGKDVFLYGFPFIHKCEGFHTSMSTQYFLLPMIANLLVYFLIIFTAGQLIIRIWKIHIPKILARTFWIVFGVFLCTKVYFSISFFNDQHLLTRDFEVAIFGTGISTFGQHSTDRSQFNEQLENWNNQDEH